MVSNVHACHTNLTCSFLNPYYVIPLLHEELKLNHKMVEQPHKLTMMASFALSDSHILSSSAELSSICPLGCCCPKLKLPTANLFAPNTDAAAAGVPTSGSEEDAVGFVSVVVVTMPNCR